jgi:hypothetical protein
MNKHAIKRKSATENYILKFLTVSSVSNDSIIKGIIDDIVNTAMKTALSYKEAKARRQKRIKSKK